MIARNRHRSRSPSRRLTALVVPAVALAAAVLAAAPSPALGLTDEVIYRKLRLDSGVAGARALGRGGAFLGQADDPTAAVVNPAGLAFAGARGVHVELAAGRLRSRHDGAPGVFPGAEPSGDGTYRPTGPETAASGSFRLAREAAARPAFLAYVQPLPGRLVLAVSRHERLDERRDARLSFRSGTLPPIEGRLPGLEAPVAGSAGFLRARADEFAVTLAGAPSERFAIGASVALARLDVVSAVEHSTYVILDQDGDGAADTLATVLSHATQVDDSDTAFSFTAGVLWRPHARVGIGAAYRHGPRFQVTRRLADDGLNAASLRSYLASAAGGRVATVDGDLVDRIHLPAEIGVGFAFGPFGPFGGREGGVSFSAAVDAVHLRAGRLSDGLVAGLDSASLGPLAAGVVHQSSGGTGLRLGLELSWPLASDASLHLRVGGYREPEGGVSSPGRATGLSDPATGQPIAAGAFGPEAAVTHGTLGLGVRLPRGASAFHLDAALDLSSLGRELKLAAGYRF